MYDAELVLVSRLEISTFLDDELGEHRCFVNCLAKVEEDKMVVYSKVKTKAEEKAKLTAEIAHESVADKDCVKLDHDRDDMEKKN